MHLTLSQINADNEAITVNLHVHVHVHVYTSLVNGYYLYAILLSLTHA